MEEGCKSRAICPRCGELNFKPYAYYKSKMLDEYGIEHYPIVYKIKYKCITCKHVWSEIEWRG